MKKIIALTVCAILFAGSVFAQDYKNAIGIRGGVGGVGITYKHHLSNVNAVEGMVAFGGNAIGVTGLYEWKAPVIAKDFNLYYGVGANIVIGNYFGIGVAGIVGLEYKIPTAPIALSIDYIPSFNVFFGEEVNPGFIWNNFSLGVKYTF